MIDPMIDAKTGEFKEPIHFDIYDADEMNALANILVDEFVNHERWYHCIISGHTAMELGIANRRDIDDFEFIIKQKGALPIGMPSIRQLVEWWWNNGAGRFRGSVRPMKIEKGHIKRSAVLSILDELEYGRMSDDGALR